MHDISTQRSLSTAQYKVRSYREVIGFIKQKRSHQMRWWIMLCSEKYIISVESSYLLYLQNQCTIGKRKERNKVISRHIPISPGAPHTLPVGFLTPCSRLPGYAGCTSFPTCSMWWCAGDGQAAQTGWGPLHVQSWIHALPKQMFGHPHSSVHSDVHWHAAWCSSQSGWCTHLSTPHKGWSTQLLCVLRLGLDPLGVPASGGESLEVGTLLWCKGEPDAKWWEHIPTVREGPNRIPREEDKFSSATPCLNGPASQWCKLEAEKFSWQSFLALWPS